MSSRKDKDKSGGDGRFFSTTKKGETQELRTELQSARLRRRKSSHRRAWDRARPPSRLRATSRSPSVKK